MKMKNLFAGIGIVTLVTPIACFTAGIIFTAVANAKSPEVAKALEEIKKRLSSSNDDENKEYISSVHKEDDEALKHAKELADEIQAEEIIKEFGKDFPDSYSCDIVEKIFNHD